MPPTTVLLRWRQIKNAANSDAFNGGIKTQKLFNYFKEFCVTLSLGILFLIYQHGFTNKKSVAYT